MQSRFKEILETSALTLCILLTGCHDEDFGGKNIVGDRMEVIVSVPSSWQSGIGAPNGHPATRCAKVTMFDESGEQPLYLHTTTEIDSTRKVATAADTRGDMVSQDNFHDFFSLSAICYTGQYPTDETQNKWTPNFAYNHKYKGDGRPDEGVRTLHWPGSGTKIKFFAFAPYTHSSISFSEEDHEGSPELTFTVPDDAKDHIDLMVASADVTTYNDVTLNFDHVLTAVKVKVDDSMPECEIVKVTISGIYNKGTYNMGSGFWKLSSSTGSCIVESPELTSDKPEMIVDGSYTMLMLPQTLPAGATLEIILKDKLTHTERTISGSIGSNGSAEWEKGKVVTYKVSNKSISMAGDLGIEFPSLEAYDNKIPYTGVLYGVELNPKVKMSQIGVEGTQEVAVSDLSSLTLEYSVQSADNSWSTWTGIGLPDGNSTEGKTLNHIGNFKNVDGGGFIGILDASSVSTNLKSGLNTASINGTADNPQKMEEMHGRNETANCYMTDTPGYYSFPLVYGNALKNGAANESAYILSDAVKDSETERKNTDGTIAAKVKGMNHYVNSNNKVINQPYIYDDPTVKNVAEAILVWQDSPDLVRDVKLSSDGKRVEFHIDERTIAQGNAMIAVRDAKDDTGVILWSWHIWVTTTANISQWNSGYRIEATDAENNTYEYFITPTNLGYCKYRSKVAERKIQFKIKGTLKVKSQTGSDIDVICEETKEFTQDGIQGSVAGDNTYYQWGRKDPMPPGVYAKAEAKDYYGPSNNSSNSNNLENKKLFNVHPNYTSTRTPPNPSFHPMATLDNRTCDIDKPWEGVDIGYTIRHPNEHIMGDDATGALVITDNGNLDFRKHWHNNKNKENYLYKDPESTTPPVHYVLYNLWNAAATGPGVTQSNDKSNFQAVTKTIYDPCPPGFHVPSAGVFLGVAEAGSSGEFAIKDGQTPELIGDTYWEVPVSKNSTECVMFYATGVRDFNFKKEVAALITREDTGFPGWYKDSWCSFQQITFITTSTLAWTSGGTYQELIFFADRRKPGTDKNENDGIKPAGQYAFKFGACADSNDAYGLPVRPVKD